jgi:hypothetical protein
MNQLTIYRGMGTVHAPTMGDPARNDLMMGHIVENFYGGNYSPELADEKIGAAKGRMILSMIEIGAHLYCIYKNDPALYKEVVRRHEIGNDATLRQFGQKFGPYYHFLKSQETQLGQRISVDRIKQLCRIPDENIGLTQPDDGEPVVLSIGGYTLPEVAKMSPGELKETVDLLSGETRNLYLQLAEKAKSDIEEKDEQIRTIRQKFEHVQKELNDYKSGHATVYVQPWQFALDGVEGAMVRFSDTIGELAGGNPSAKQLEAVSNRIADVITRLTILQSNVDELFETLDDTMEITN